MQQEIVRLTVLQRSVPAFDALIGAHVTWLHLVAQAQQVALTDHDVLLVGEQGSGRASIARAMHVASPRAGAPLIEVDLGVYQGSAQAVALFGETGSGGAWAEAGSGSLLLRGLGEATPLHAQLVERIGAQGTRTGPRLFVIASADQALPDPLQARMPVRLRVPPLRERTGDVLLIARAFAGERAITPAAAQALASYTWPGNVTELGGVVEHAARLAGSGAIDVMHLPDQVQPTSEQAMRSPMYLPPEGVNLEQVEQALIRQAIERARGNKSRAAELLGLTRHTLLYRMEKYGIS